MTDIPVTDIRPLPAHGVSFGEALRVWMRVAAISFGGPAGQIAIMHRTIVDEKKSVGESRFLPGHSAAGVLLYLAGAVAP